MAKTGATPQGCCARPEPSLSFSRVGYRLFPRLSRRIIHQNMTRKARYTAWIRTDEWKELATACKARDGWACTRCGATERLAAHHTLYPRDIRNTTLNHLITVCHKCHEKIHGRKLSKFKVSHTRKMQAQIKLLEDRVKDLEESVGALIALTQP